MQREDVVDWMFPQAQAKLEELAVTMMLVGLRFTQKQIHFFLGVGRHCLVLCIVRCGVLHQIDRFFDS